MSETGVSIGDLKQLRRIGTLLDDVLVGLERPADRSFRRACDELAATISASTTNPPQDLQGLILLELVGHHFSSKAKRYRDMLDDLRAYHIGLDTRRELEILAQALERDKSAATARIQSTRY